MENSRRFGADEINYLQTALFVIYSRKRFPENVFRTTTYNYTHKIGSRGKDNTMVSIRDVAKHAGVAISTVSKVLNHYPNVSEETKEKVNVAIKELNFVPNTIAAALSSKQSGRVALIMNLNTQTQAIDEIGMQYLQGAIGECRELGLDVITVFYSMIRDKNPEEMEQYFRSQSISGIIVYGISKDDNALQQLVNSQAFKTVVIDAPFVSESTSTVWVDHKQAQKDVARHTILTNLGNSSKILYISGKNDDYVTDIRIEGMYELAEELNLDLMICNGNFSEYQARQITFEHGEERDIIVCASDLMAIGAMKALIEMDIFRPVCGFDGLTLMGYVGKQMNTIRQNFSNISKEAVKELARLMDGSEGRNVIMPHEIVRLRYEDIIR